MLPFTSCSLWMSLLSRGLEEHWKLLNALWWHRRCKVHHQLLNLLRSRKLSSWLTYPCEGVWYGLLNKARPSQYHRCLTHIFDFLRSHSLLYPPRIHSSKFHFYNPASYCLLYKDWGVSRSMVFQNSSPSLYPKILTLSYHSNTGSCIATSFQEEGPLICLNHRHVSSAIVQPCKFMTPAWFFLRLSVDQIPRHFIYPFARKLCPCSLLACPHQQVDCN